MLETLAMSIKHQPDIVNVLQALAIYDNLKVLLERPDDTIAYKSLKIFSNILSDTDENARAVAEDIRDLLFDQLQRTSVQKCEALLCMYNIAAEANGACRDLITCHEKFHFAVV